jgi:hypothetical protein
LALDITTANLYGEGQMTTTRKARPIEKLEALSAEEKKENTDFFTKHSNYENHIDWNKTKSKDRSAPPV